jgi:predicted RNA polymerase sigma factor/predicted enzyme related to lactoylglutathione lyase
LIDQRRSEQSRRKREELAAIKEGPAADVPEHDDTLTVLFMCSHPALTPASAIALTLRAVGGLTTAQIANAFLVPAPTMAQRISRAKQTIKVSGVPFRMPTPDEQLGRLRNVLHVLYLIFNEGYATSTGEELHRVELSEEAIRLTRLVHRDLPGAPEVAGLLALMLLTDSRRRARTTADGELIPLAEQDRTLWDRALIVEGIALVSDAVAKGRVGEYQIQAAIAAIHDQTPKAEVTDWPQILALYGLLERVTGNPIVTLNRAVAAAMAQGPSAGLAVLAGVEDRLAGHYRLDAVRAHLLEMTGDTEAALAHYRMAAARTTSLPEQRYLATQAARLRARTGGELDMPYVKDPRVDAYIDPLPAWQREIFSKVRDLVHEADPGVEETIKRTVQPYFVLDGNVCAFLAAKDHASIFLYDGAIVPDPEGIITAGHDNKTGRMIAVRRDEKINERALVTMFRQIIANNRAGGWRKLKGQVRRSQQGGDMNLNGILIGSDNPKRLADYYTKLFGKPGWDEGGYTGWQIGTGSVTVGPHDQVKGKNAHPGRLLWNIESSDVEADFARFKAAGATVVREPYTMGDEPGSIATFSDPDDNYFQLMSPMQP